MLNHRTTNKELKVMFNHNLLNNIQNPAHDARLPEKNDEDDYVMYILINECLKDIDKIITQCCNLSCEVVRTLENFKEKPEYYTKWLDESANKVILRASEEDLIYCISNYSNQKQRYWCHFTLDINTEADNKQNPILITAVAFAPMMKKRIPKFLLAQK
jgi:peptidyl-tRNA hydrolase